MKISIHIIITGRHRFQLSLSFVVFYLDIISYYHNTSILTFSWQWCRNIAFIANIFKTLVRISTVIERNNSVSCTYIARKIYIPFHKVTCRFTQLSQLTHKSQEIDPECDLFETHLQKDKYAEWFLPSWSINKGTIIKQYVKAFTILHICER